MRGLSFLSRLAFICNLLFFVCLVIQRIHNFKGFENLNEVVIVLGWFLAPFINLVVCIRYGIILIRKKNLTIPVWLVVVNFLFLILQFFVHFILPS